MENAGVDTAGNDRAVGKAMRTAADELVDEFSFDFPLADTGLDESQHAAEACLGDVAGDLGKLDFLLGFHAAQSVDQRGEAVVFMQRVKRLAFLCEAQGFCFEGQVAAGMFIC